MALYTIGYQGRSLDKLIDILNAYDIRQLLDVRENAWSRKPGFTKGELEEAFDETDIGYRHVESLGNPKSFREKADSTEECLQMYREYLEEEPPDTLEDVAELADREDICLMCYEADPEECHRRVITDLIGDIEPVHLT
jgi:uncharacterized protein (DUF488 family)